VRRPRSLNPTEITDLTNDLTRLTTLLHRPDITRILAGIATAATPGYPRTASGTAHTNDNTSDGDILDCLTETTVLWATGLLGDLHLLRTTIPAVNTGIMAILPDRSVAKCQHCDHPFDRGSKVCRHVDTDGTPCQASADADPLCIDCGEPMARGQRHGGRCPSCHQFKLRNGYTKATIATYAAALEHAVIVDGVAHA
jgi:hypothetical protein